MHHLFTECRDVDVYWWKIFNCPISSQDVYFLDINWILVFFWIIEHQKSRNFCSCCTFLHVNECLLALATYNPIAQADMLHSCHPTSNHALGYELENKQLLSSALSLMFIMALTRPKSVFFNLHFVKWMTMQVPEKSGWDIPKQTLSLLLWDERHWISRQLKTAIPCLMTECFILYPHMM